MLTNQPYGQEFFDEVSGSSMASARVIVPMVIDLVEPHSVVDVGCAQGAWLQVFRERGVPTIRGYDGDYVSRSELLIPEAAFEARDLSQPLSTEATFDLAVCLEVGEHLPDARAASFVADLTRLSNVVLFSAAMPGQGGQGHINEQWPEYWTELFGAHHYEPVECLRPRLASQSEVAWWFRQNIMLFVNRGAVDIPPKLLAEREACRGRTWEWVHTKMLRREPTLRGLLSDLPRAAVRVVQHRAWAWRKAHGRGEH